MPGEKDNNLYIGEVVNNKDPENLIRIKARVVGKFEPESPWCQPIGQPGSGGTRNGTQKGRVEVPPVGANVAILFEQGNVQRPCYLPGPWGCPNGVTDVPNSAIIEDENRQSVVEECEEFEIIRDGRTTDKFYQIKHKSSGLIIRIDGIDNKIYFAADDADQALIRGTEYRAEEASVLSDIASALFNASVSLNTAGTDPVFSGLAPAAASAIVSAGTQLMNASTSISGSQLITASSYLSQKVFTD